MVVALRIAEEGCSVTSAEPHAADLQAIFLAHRYVDVRQHCSRRINVKRRVAAAVEGARTAGIDVARVEVDKDGRIVIIAGKSTDGAEVNTLDEWMAKNARQAQGA